MSPKKNSDQIAMGQHDRLMAIKRHPEFQKDMAEREKILATGNENLFLEMDNILNKKWGYPIEKIEAAEKHYELKKKGKSPLSWAKKVTHIEEPPIVSFKADDGKGRLDSWETGLPLYIKVDLNGPKKAIIKDIERIIDKNKPRRGKRASELTINPWEVYDKKQSGVSVQKIIKEKYGFRISSPIDDPKFWARYHEGRRGYKRALDMINNVTPPEVTVPFPKKN